MRAHSLAHVQVSRVASAAAAVQADLAALSQGAPNQAQAPGAPVAAGQAGGGAAPAHAPPAPADGEAAVAGQPSGFKKEVEDDANYIFQQARQALELLVHVNL